MSARRPAGHTPEQIALVRRLFDAAAERYARDVEPVLAPLTAHFIGAVGLRPTDRVLEAGTGTGLVARLIAPLVRQVIGVDLSPMSLRAARSIPTAARIDFVQADLACLPFAAGAFSLIVASFGLNMTDPHRTLRALWRVLAPGGRLGIQEWGPSEPLQRDLIALLYGYATDDPPARLAWLRDEFDAHPPPWERTMQDTDDYREALAEAGFAVETADEVAPLAIRLPSPDRYLRYLLARPLLSEEVRAMERPAHDAFYAAALDRVRADARPDGSLMWQPVVLRVVARRVC